MPFNGFPDGVRLTPVPDPFFNALLVEIKDVVELKVTLRAFWLLSQERGAIRALVEGELLNDPTLLQGLQGLGGDPPEQAQAGLAKAVARKTLLRCPAAAGSSESPRYLLNTAANRRHLARQGDGTVPGPNNEPPLPPGDLDTPAAAVATRTNIYALYEDNIGLIGPQLAQYLQEAEDSYPERWIADAFAIAIRENKRSWSYISAILRRWAAEGRLDLAKSEGIEPAAAPGIGVKAGAALWPGERIENGKPGRHSAPDRRARGTGGRRRR